MAKLKLLMILVNLILLLVFGVKRFTLDRMEPTDTHLTFQIQPAQLHLELMQSVVTTLLFLALLMMLVLKLPLVQLQVPYLFLIPLVIKAELLTLHTQLEVIATVRLYNLLRL